MLRPLLALVLIATGGLALAADLTVFAAASLTDAFSEIGRAFDARSGNHTAFQFAGSQVLRTQIENGARADVFASADAAQYEPLAEKKLIPAARVFTRNRLVVIASRRAGRVASLADLARPGVRLVLAGEAVPSGRYAREALAALEKSGSLGSDYSARVLANLMSEETSVRQVALKVQIGEADAGIVYSSDVTPALLPSVRRIEIPAAANQTADYPIGVLNGSSKQTAARAFVAFVLSQEGQKILHKWGFSPLR